jgi:hypothetical protein
MASADQGVIDAEVGVRIAADHGERLGERSSFGRVASDRDVESQRTVGPAGRQELL